MERNLSFTNLYALALWAVIWPTSVAHAETVILPAPRPVPVEAGYDPEGPDRYPESRFGSPPAKFEPGVSSGYAARQAEELERGDDEESRPGNRRPAGLEFATVGSARSAGSRRPTLTSTRREPLGAPVSSRGVIDAGPSLSEAAGMDTGPTQAEIARKGVQEIALIAGDLGFFPRTFFVSRDVPVRIFVTSASRNSLCIMMDSFQVRRQIRSQRIEEISFTPSTPGKYRFYCPVNGTEGTMVVKELANLPNIVSSAGD